MSFIYPSFLFALFAVSIPIAIHLFNFRRFKKIYFSDIRFLKEIKLQTQNRNRLKHLLILLSRILAISSLVFAFAQPYIPLSKSDRTAGVQAVSIYVDNSFSMENIAINGVLLDEARKIARELALVHNQSDQFQLLTNDFEAKHQRLVSRDEFLTLLDEVQVSPAVKSISEIDKRQNDLLHSIEHKSKKAYLISDFQKSNADFNNIAKDTTLKTTLLPIAANQQNNLYIDSCWFDSPVNQLNQTQKLNVRIINKSDNGLENIPAKLFINNQQKSPSSFNILPNEDKVIQFSFVIKTAGIQQGRIEIADYPITYDDKYYFSFKVEHNIAITCVSNKVNPKELKPGLAMENETQISIQSLFGKDSLFVLTMADESKMDYSALASQQVIILNELNSISSGLAQELLRFTEKGGSLVIFPPTSLELESYAGFLKSLNLNYFLTLDTAKTRIDWVNRDSDIFSDVFEKSANERKSEYLDLPIIQKHWILSSAANTNQDALLKLKDGNTCFSKFIFKKGKIYLSAIGLNAESSNLTKHAIFVPLMYKIAMNSQTNEKLAYILGRNAAIQVQASKTGENLFKIKSDSANSASSFEIIPENKIVETGQTIFVHDQIKNAGNYLLYAGNEIAAGLSFNYDRKESDLSRLSSEELQAIVESQGLLNFSLVNLENKSIAKVLADLSQGKQLWKWCILLALVFLACEIALLRHWK